MGPPVRSCCGLSITSSQMLGLARSWGHLCFRDSGDAGSPTVLLINSLGTDLRLWDAVAERLPNLRLIRFDKRGHGLSSTPKGEWDVTDLADDALAILEHLGVARAVVAGCSVGGLIGQALALRNPERVSALLLSNTAARIGTAEMWRARIAAVETGGMAAVAPAVMARWFAPPFLATPEARLWETMLLRCEARGYIATCGALARADLTHEVGRITCPTLCLAGSEDQSTPPELVHRTADLIPGARFVCLDGSGHLPAIDAPAETARLLRELVEETNAQS